jgi:hypothetical protein
MLKPVAKMLMRFLTCIILIERKRGTEETEAGK